MDEDKKVCGCNVADESCTHEESQTEETSVEPRTPVEQGNANEEMLFALLLALTPLAIFTLFGQIGLL